ncbi:MAG: 3-hydroxyacyl-CoA dehydrogenase family protein [Bacteroidales bacterium]|nr:3-hydroxyacyl-CoA dehydrogenase family protein [Bacteroidales bacterium]
MKEKLEDYALSKSLKSDSGTIKVGIIGCGTMGQELTILVSKSGIDVVFIEISEDKVKSSFNGISNQIDDIISHWGMTEGDKRAILSRVEGSTDYKKLADCNIVIEAINTKKWIPNQPTRKEVFRKAEKVIAGNALLISNASTIVISDLASELEKPCRAIGVHFIAPALTTRVIEVNKCHNTNKESTEALYRFIRAIGKETININGSPGNISTRLIVPMINEACELLMEGVSTVAQIDKTMQMGYGMQRGPFTMADRIGLDKLTKWMEGLYNEYGDPKYKTSPIIKRMVRTGMFGVKSENGFYCYKNGKKEEKNGSIFNLGN